MSSIPFALLAGMMHELRTPLGPIGGYTELLQMGVHGEVSEAQNDLLQRIKHNQQRMVALIDAFMSYAETLSGKRTAAIEKTSLLPVVGRAVERHNGEAQRRSIDIRSKCISDCDVMSDPQLLELLLGELLHDAIGTTSDSGNIHILCEADEESLISVELSSSAQPLVAGTWENMFEPFSRESKVGVSSAALHSLALPHAQSLAHLLKIKLRGVPSESRRRFRLSIPRTAS